MTTIWCNDNTEHDKTEDDNTEGQTCVLNYTMPFPSQFSVSKDTVTASIKLPDDSPFLKVACEQSALPDAATGDYSCSLCEHKYTEEHGEIMRCGDKLEGHRSVRNGNTVMYIEGADHPVTLVIDQSQ